MVLRDGACKMAMEMNSCFRVRMGTSISSHRFAGVNVLLAGRTEISGSSRMPNYKSIL